MSSDESDDDGSKSDTTRCAIFSRTYHKADIHTHAPIQHLVYHFGKNAMQPLETGTVSLNPDASRQWNTFTRSGPVRKAVETLPKLKIPGGRMPKK